MVAPRVRRKWDGGGGTKLDEGDQKVQSFSFKISHRDIMYSMVTIVNNTILCLKVAKRATLKSYPHKKKKM